MFIIVVICVLIIVVTQTSTVIFAKFPSNNPSNSQYFRQIQLSIGIQDAT